MKNAHIKNLLQPVPEDIRLQVYKEALEYYEAGSGKGLCMLLPKTLWGLESICDNSPVGHYWKPSETQIAFPELTKQILDSIHWYDGNKTKRRIEVLREFIAILEK